MDVNSFRAFDPGQWHCLMLGEGLQVTLTTWGQEVTRHTQTTKLFSFASINRSFSILSLLIAANVVEALPLTDRGLLD